MNDVMTRMKPLVLVTDVDFIVYWSVSLLILLLAPTFCAGFMALSFWAIRLDFDPSWWAANLFLAIWPCGFLPQPARA